ncbi:MAG: hypothetical protein FCO83_02140 [Spiroplasma sp. WSS]|uniref:hypothetical protein n=1 Tax=Spiroplasma endosymbiont of Lariophagus distinguendus TaxID=2935082 RepID=UPI00120C8197|nr:hypothetical protein [Spiroplasma endosymbiont of Lariophagus distinguendus]MBP1525896.1 hypothetical protein [Spiroplasma ixodetis]MBP1528554.1 hypothetical protein [Spiroplasma ixodetis]TLF25964.1 MAG: hypothetical protein FCO83_02140 [Spiroplasma sp. WSS]
MINKKIILSTCLGNIIGGSLFTLSDLYQKREQNILEFDITSAITVLSGCFTGALFGFISGLFCCLNDEEDNGDYREFFESQQIIDNTHSFQSSNEFAPLLQEYILEINDEQFIPNNNADLVFNPRLVY